MAYGTRLHTMVGRNGLNLTRGEGKVKMRPQMRKDVFRAAEFKNFKDAYIASVYQCDGKIK